MAAVPEVSLREVTAETVRAVCALDVSPDQRGYIAPNAVSIAQAHFEPKSWFRAVYVDDTPVGFAMLHEDPEQQEYYRVSPRERILFAALYLGLIALLAFGMSQTFIERDFGDA